MQGAPFVRWADKVSFIFGVVLLIMTTYILGRHPNTLYYYFHMVTVVVLVGIRLVNYKSKGWHYYLFDFCYFANIATLYFLIYDSKNDYLFKVIFCYANGPLGLAIAAFRNSMVFH